MDLGLIVSIGVECDIMLNFDGFFIVLIMFLILGVIIVGLGYTTAIVTEEYTEMWDSKVIIWSILSFLVELMLVVLINYDDVKIIGFYNTGNE